MTAPHTHIARLLVLSACGLVLSTPAQAGGVSGAVIGSNGQAVADAVLFATPLDTPPPPAKAVEPAVVAQENSAFVPYVTVIRTGTSVRFPNRDPHDHHLKSFSPTKPFELRVYSKKEEPAPVLFDKPGDVALVCHFHNWMRGFIYVVDTPYFGKTDGSGQVSLNNLPAGRYEVKAWAPYMFGSPPAQTIQVAATGATAVKFQLTYVPKPAPAPRMPSKEKDADYSY
jgi:plastocyanin